MACCFAAALLSGCSLQMNAADLLKPPRLTAEQSAIYDALEAAIGTDSFKLKYPRSGSNLSACTLHDLDGDGQEEAVAFYELTSGGSASTWVSVLTRLGDGWKSVKQISGAASEIDRLEFASILGKEDSIVVGWSATGEENNTCTFYTYTGGQLEKYKTDFPYNEMLIDDVDADGLEEVVLCTLNGTRTATMALLHEAGGRIVRTSQIGISPRLTGYTQLVAGELASGMPVVLADVTLSNGNMDTAIGLVGKNASRTIIEELSGDELGIYESFEREPAVLCGDVNGDGLLDIPTAEPLPGYDVGGEEEILWRITYRSILDGKLTAVQRLVQNDAGGYRFVFPQNWDDAVTVRRRTDNGEWRFILYNGDLADEAAVQLLRIRVVSPSDYQDKFETERYTTIAAKGSYEYQLWVPEEGAAGYSITADEAQALFSLLS